MEKVRNRAVLRFFEHGHNRTKEQPTDPKADLCDLISKNFHLCQTSAKVIYYYSHPK